jgi:hypothetical protein
MENTRLYSFDVRKKHHVIIYCFQIFSSTMNIRVAKRRKKTAMVQGTAEAAPVLTPQRTTTTTSTGEIINKTVMVPLVPPVQESTPSTSQTPLDAPFEDILMQDPDPDYFEIPNRKNNVQFF